MLRILRPDHVLIRNDDNSIILKNINFDNVEYPIKPIHAFLMSLHNGERDDFEIRNSLRIILDRKDSEIDMFINKFNIDYKRFLLPVEKASKIFQKPWKNYNPKDFLLKQEKVFKELKSLPAPKVISLYLTNNCIRQCKYCYAKANLGNKVENNSITTDEIKNILNQAFMLGVDELLLTGGEPLLRPDIYEIINYAISFNIKVNFFTKARINLDKFKDMDKSLVNMGFSIDSHIPDICNYLVGSTTFYSDMMKNINELKSINFPYGISMVVTSINKESLTDTISYFLNQGARHIDIDHYTCTNELELNKNLFVEESEKDIIQVKLDDFIEKNNFKNRVNYLPYKKDIKDVCKLNCATGRSRLTIRFDGKYVFCEQLANAKDINLSDVHSKSILEAWNSEELKYYINPKRDLYKSTQCYECAKFDYCTGKNSCISRSMDQHGVYFRPNKEVEHVCFKR